MAAKRNDLYRWKRWTKEKPQTLSSVSKTPSTIDEIEDWLKKIDKASEEAAAITFGTPKARTSSYLPNGHLGAMATIDALHDHDEAYSEAQDLLTQWMSEKCKFDDDEDLADQLPDQSESDIKMHWDQILHNNDPRNSSEAMFDEIESRDDNRTTGEILNGFMEQDMGENLVKRDLGLKPKKKKDPRVTMAARHLKVKENREKREKERLQKLQERQTRKNAQLQARQMVKEEERLKAQELQKEEMMLQQEMAKIRKEMQQQKLEAEERARQKRAAEEEARRQMQCEEEERYRYEEAKRQEEAERMLQAQRETLRKKAEQLKAMEAAENLKLLQRHFQAWYQLILDRHLSMGKAHALSDWRCLLRAWNAWRAFHRAHKAEKEAKETEEFLKKAYRKKQLAMDHYRRHLLQKYLNMWQVWIQCKEEESRIHNTQQHTKDKMAAFLEAAASGKLWTSRSESTEVDLGSGGAEERQATVMKRPVTGGNNNITSRSSSTVTLMSSSKSHSVVHANTKPKFAWQVTRKHLKLKPEEITNLGEDESHITNRNQNNSALNLDLQSLAGSPREKSSKKEISYKVNNFEHRYAAQQKILREQRDQLKEQQRLIEDLQTAQKQQLILMQIQQIQKNGARHDGVGLAVGGNISGDKGPMPSSVRTDISNSSHQSSNQCDILSTERTQSSAEGATEKFQKPPMLKGMEERAALRAQKKAEREQRMRKKEEERLASLKAEEEKKKAEEEAEKQAQIEKRREIKRMQKQKEKEKEERLKRVAEMNKTAEKHYRHQLMRIYGLKPWKQLKAMAEKNLQVAVDHHSDVFARKIMLPWLQYTSDIKHEKEKMADQLYQELLLRRSLSSWKKYGHYLSILYQKARKHYAMRAKLKLFKAWQDYTVHEKLTAWRHEELAAEHNQKRIIKIAFIAWRKYPRMLKLERQREKTKEEMRKKVASILPDFGGL